MPLIIYAPPGQTGGSRWSGVSYAHLAAKDDLILSAALSASVPDGFRYAYMALDPETQTISIKLEREMGASSLILRWRNQTYKDGRRKAQAFVHCPKWREQFKLQGLALPARFRASYDESKRRVVIELRELLWRKDAGQEAKGDERGS